MSSSVSVRRAWPVAALAVVIAVVAALLSPITAQASTIALTGKVVARSGAPLAGVTVDLVVQSAANPTIAATATSTSAGTFSMPPVAPGYYTLKFGATPSTFAQYLGGTSDFGASPTGAPASSSSTTWSSLTQAPSCGPRAARSARTSRIGSRDTTIRAASAAFAGVDTRAREANTS